MPGEQTHSRAHVSGRRDPRPNGEEGQAVRFALHRSPGLGRAESGSDTAENVRLQKRETLVGTEDPSEVSRPSPVRSTEDGLGTGPRTTPRCGVTLAPLGKMCP